MRRSNFQLKSPTWVMCALLAGLCLLGGLPLAAAAGNAPEAQLFSEEIGQSFSPNTGTPTPAPTATPPPLTEVRLVSPDDGALTTAISDPPNGSPTLRWQKQAAATRYHVQISTSAGFAQIVEEADTLTDTWTPLRSLADGIFYWRVKAGNLLNWGPYGNPRYFTKDWGAGGSVVAQPLAPPQGAQLSSFSDPVFSWTPVPGAARYLFQIDADYNFGSVDYSAISDVAAHTPSVRLANGVYYWRVTPIDFRDHYGLPSPATSFTFEWAEVPQLVAPEDASQLTFTPEFRWTAVQAARDYRLEISTSPDFSTITFYTTRNPAFTPDRNLANDQEYYWRVRAVDAQLNNGPWSQVRRFQMRWNLAPRLLTPRNNQIALSHPVFTWMPVPGAEKYQIQVDESAGFALPLKVDERVYAPAYAHGNWGTFYLNSTYYWRVRAIDARGNMTPWSEVRGFDFGTTFGPNPIFPPYYAAPDSNLDVTDDTTQASPLFMWDTVHDASGTSPFPAADRYELDVRDATTNQRVFALTTAANAAAPTTDNPFSGALDGRLYVWTIRAFLGSQQLGGDMVSLARFDSAAQRLPAANPIRLVIPDDGRETTVDAPVLGWQPVDGAAGYRVQIAKDAAFGQIVDDAVAQFLNYVPYERSSERLPNGTYYWRVRPEPNGAWSEVRHFNVSHRLLTGNQYDYPLAPPIVDQPLNRIASGGDSELNGLYLAQDRFSDQSRLSWVIGLDTSPAANRQFGIYFDTNHCTLPAGPACPGGPGAGADPLGKPIVSSDLNRPEYVLYATRNGNTADAGSTVLYHWNGDFWDPPQTLASIGGAVSDSGGDVEIRLPYVALGSGNADWIGSLALAAFTSSSGAGVRVALPAASGNTLVRFAFASDALNPVYPFDTPAEGLLVHYNMPVLRWLMPYWDSVDGYQVEVARDPGFTDIVETWESYESAFTPDPHYEFLPTAFTTKLAYSNNQSYYWRVRVRHEIYTHNPDPPLFDYGPWSQGSRFTLDSLSTSEVAGGMVASPTFATPTFIWPRLEGASGYQLQVDDNSDFSSPVVNQTVDGVSYTPTDTSIINTIGEGTYFWRVAPRRSLAVLGGWSATQTFTRASPYPQPIAPANGSTIHNLPTLRWDILLTPLESPRLAAPRYRVKLDDDPNFGSPLQIDTSSTSVTPVWHQAIHDGTWYWKVAYLDGNNREGPYSPRQQFYKEYLPPVLLSPAPGAFVGTIPTFRWQPQAPGAYYRLQYDDNETFNSPATVTTDNTVYTPTGTIPAGPLYWRVQLVDADNQAGPYALRSASTGGRQVLPLIRKRR